MPDIQAFCGVRYDLGHVGELSNVIAPPYDVIDAAYQADLYKRHPANVVRLILNRQEPGDDEETDRYRRAAKFLKQWREEGVLAADPQPSVYVYHQEFEYAGRRFNRRGLLARVKLERFGEGKIYPHEITMSGPKADRLRLTRACQANLSPIFGLYPDPDNLAQELVESRTIGQEPVACTDDLGVVNRLWPVSDSETIAKLAGVIGPQPMYVADGHHRYETACNYRDELAAAGKLTPEHPANYVLTMLISMQDPGLIVLPTQRLFRGLPRLAAEELIAALGDCFTCRIIGEGTDLAGRVWTDIETGDDQGVIGLYCAADERWVLASITDAGRARMAEVAADQTDVWRGLGVSILHRLIVETLLGVAEPPKPRYVHLVQEVVDGLEAEPEEFPIAALVMPATLEHVRQISELGARMPAKSTYFYPKLLSGMVINPLA